MLIFQCTLYFYQEHYRAFTRNFWQSSRFVQNDRVLGTNRMFSNTGRTSWKLFLVPSRSTQPLWL